LLRSVKTGGIAFDKAFGENVWEFFAKHPDNAQIFNDAMTGMTIQATEALHAAYQFTGINVLMDVGGGHGGWIMSILQRNPQMRGILFDSPQVIEGAKSHIAGSDFADRCELVGGNFFKSVPEGADAITLKWIIHDWNDEKALAILMRCRETMAPDSRLVLVEHVLPAHAKDSADSRRIFMDDVQMLVMLAGKERTEDEYRQLMDRAGINLTRVVSTESIFQLIEGVPV
jgi:hypothetical protein